MSLEVEGPGKFTFFNDTRAELRRITKEGEAIAGVEGPFAELLIDDLEDQGARITTTVLFERFQEIDKDLRVSGNPVTPENVILWLKKARERRASQ